MKNFFAFLFFVVTVVELSAHLFGTGLNVYSKPLLMPVLMFYFLAGYQFNTDRRSAMVILVLVLSCAGDISLMGQTSGRFIAGLSCFLFAHVAYVVIFIKEGKSTLTSIHFSWKLLLPMVIYLGVLLSFLIPTSGAMMIPVIVYGLAIMVMWYTAALVFGLRATNASWFIIVGSTLFVLSDSMIGINKFYAPLPQSSFLIMSTYIGGQFLIITGLLTHFQKTRSVSTSVA
ncbi:MAG: lysoplasmalogenase [Bacteroidota bacterium]